ncbi:hypothetical protein V2J09_022020, partial [Rumex salicifolius]
VADNFFQNGTGNGKFSIGSALEIIRGEVPITQTRIWKQIWDLKAPERIKYFLWLIAHDCIFSNANQARRHISSSTSCGSCGDLVESTFHIVKWCVSCQNYGRVPRMCVIIWWIGCHQIWRFHLIGHAPLPLLCGGFGGGAMQESLEVKKKSRKKSVSLFFTGGSTGLAMENPSKEISRGRVNRNRAGSNWIPPKEPWIKLNVEGSFLPYTRAIGVGGIIRNSLGVFVGGFTAKRIRDSAFLAELIKVYHGLKLKI